MEAEVAAEKAMDAVDRAKLEELEKLEGLLAPVFGGAPSDDDCLTWTARLYELNMELYGCSSIVKHGKCGICFEVISAGAPGTISCAKCGAFSHSECVITLLQDGKTFDYTDSFDHPQTIEYDKACPICSFNMITGEKSAKMRKDEASREADARRAAADARRAGAHLCLFFVFVLNLSVCTGGGAAAAPIGVRASGVVQLVRRPMSCGLGFWMSAPRRPLHIADDMKI
jgi:hypothetical protein